MTQTNEIPTRFQAQAYGETRWFDTLEEAQNWVAEREAEMESDQ